MTGFFYRFLMFRHFGLSRFGTMIFWFLTLFWEALKDFPGNLEVLFHDCMRDR